MIFVTVECDAGRMKLLTPLLVKAYPGCTIYEYQDIEQAAEFSISHKVDAVLVDNSSNVDVEEFSYYLYINKENLPIYVVQNGLASGTFAHIICGPLTVENLKANIAV
ncbi:MAG: hypothetical protein SPF70_07430 [Lachnospiraceae bacterium]|nr:hypothetical protein [Lachnospiraceae bacterium]